MGSVGDAYDNAFAESFFGTLQLELLDRHDWRSRDELAGALMARGDRDGAADALFAIIAADRDWNEGAARTRLLQFLEVVGLEDPWVSAQRRRLSAILFT